MPRALFYGQLLHGHVNPTLGVVKDLVDRGHEIIYFTSEEMRRKVENCGAVYQNSRLLDNVNINVSFSLNNQLIELDTLLKACADFYKNWSFLFKLIDEEVKKFKPDYIMYDDTLFAPKRAANILNIPAVSFITTLSYHRKMLDIAPDYVLEKILRLKDSYMKDINMTLRIIYRFFKALEFSLGFKDLSLIDTFFPYCNHLNIVFTHKEFQPYNDIFDDSFRFVGPSLLRREKNVDFTFDKLMNRKLIYISLGSIFSDSDVFINLYKMFFEAFRDTPYQVILYTNVTDEKLHVCKPENFIMTNSIPQLEVLKIADLFITHGGMNSANEAIYYGVPLIVFPLALDHFLVAEQVERVGVGVDTKKFTNLDEIQLRELTDKVLTDPKIRNNVARLSSLYKKTGGYKTAAEDILKFLESKKVKS